MALEDIDPVVQAVLLACLTYISKAVAAWWAEKKEHKKDIQRLRNEHELVRIDFQIREVFGPLRGCLLLAHSVFTALLIRHKLGGHEAKKDVAEFFKQVNQPVQGGEKGLSPVQKDGILWLKHILQPANIKVRDVIVNKSSGFTVMPKFLANVTAHIAENDVILAKIDSGQYDHLTATLKFRHRMNNFVEKEFNAIQKRKRVMLEAMNQDHSIGQTTAEEYGEGGRKMQLVGPQ